jgi:hypothetical protein
VPARALDEHPVGELPAIAADVRLDEVAAGELRAVRAVEQVRRVVRGGIVVDVLAGAVEPLSPRAERGIVIEAKILRLAPGLRRYLAEEGVEAPVGRLRGDVVKGHGRRAEDGLPFGDVDPHGDRDVGAEEARHRHASG